MYEVPQEQLIEEVAIDLKKVLHKPDWADYVKTGTHTQRPPVRDDWWFVRAAAMLRTVHKLGPIGVSKLRTKYGGLKNRGVRPSQHKKGSGSVARKILQQLEEQGFIKQDVKGAHKGRVTTPKGDSILFGAAKRVAAKDGSQKPPRKLEQESPVVKEKVVVKKKAAKKSEQQEVKD